MEKLTLDNYYSVEANIEYLSVSQFKDFRKCELYGREKALGRYTEERGKPLVMGGYFDAHFAGTLDKYKEENPSIYKKDGTLLKDYEKVNECIKVAESDELFMSKLQGQKQVILTGVIGGVDFKGALDFLNEDIVDLKLVASITEPVWKYNPETKRNYQTNFIDAYEYDLQGAVYQELVRQNLNQDKDFVLAPVSKEDEPDKALIKIDNDILKEKLKLVEELAPRYDMIKKGIIDPIPCGNCPVCRKLKKLDRVINYREFYGIGEEDE